MKYVNLDLCLSNLIVRDGNFIINENNVSVRINPNIAVKLCDFGLAEKYNPSTNDFNVNKWGLKVYDELLYDGMKSDIWSLGVILLKYIDYQNILIKKC